VSGVQIPLSPLSKPLQFSEEVFLFLMFYTYILYSQSTNSFYKGHTNDITARLSRHNGKREKYTSKGCPWILVWFAEKGSKSEAYQFEMKLKNLSRDRLIKLMLKFEENIGGPDELFLIKQLSGR
jgi:putative endonuclease